MNLLYLSCHGVQDKQGRLYFAFTDTERDFLGSTAVSAEWVRECIYASRSKSTLVLVDCCFSGGFIKGMRARSTGANVEALVQDVPQGTGIAVLTASGDTEASFEDAESATTRPSYFTDALITGISSGAADRNRDGRITADELYDHIYDEVVCGPSPQRPRRLGAGEGTLVVADAGTRTLPVPRRQLGLLCQVRQRHHQPDPRGTPTAIDAAHAPARPWQPASTEPPSNQGPSAAPTNRDMTNHGIDAALRASFEDDHRRGNLDGSLAATKLPLSALDHLVAGQFDVVRWLTPWRQYWLHALSQPQYVHSVPSWLPELAGYLGSHVAPRGSTNSTFTPTAAYLTGFCAGMRNTWNKAVAARVLPPDRSTLTHWMTQPANWLKAGAYLADATICDMTMAQKRAKRAALTRTALRVVLWVTTGAFLLMEIAAIAVTIQGSWTESDGTVAKSQTANAIGANLCFSIALIALCALVIVDMKRQNRKNAAAKVASNSTPGDGNDHVSGQEANA